MNTKILYGALTSLMLCGACSTNSRSTRLPFEEARNYFVNNSVGEYVPDKIVSQAGFDKYFGMAATMGENGRPTPIDFSRSYVIPVVLPPTDTLTTVEPVSLTHTADGKIDLNYKVTKKGGRQSYTTRPFTLIIVDNSNSGDIILTPSK